MSSFSDIGFNSFVNFDSGLSSTSMTSTNIHHSLFSPSSSSSLVNEGLRWNYMLYDGHFYKDVFEPKLSSDFVNLCANTNPQQYPSSTSNDTALGNNHFVIAKPAVLDFYNYCCCEALDKVVMDMVTNLSFTWEDQHNYLVDLTDNSPISSSPAPIQDYSLTLNNAKVSNHESMQYCVLTDFDDVVVPDNVINQNDCHPISELSDTEEKKFESDQSSDNSENCPPIQTSTTVPATSS